VVQILEIQRGREYLIESCPIKTPDPFEFPVVSIFPRFVDRREGNGKIRQARMAAKSVLCTIARENHSYSAMNVSPQKPRSILAALTLMGGWGDILFGIFILIVGGKTELATAFNFVAGGADLVALIYYFEHRKRG
jgi:hypothetical protein